MIKTLENLEVKTAAKRLLGAMLIRTLPGGQQLSGKIVEVEGYEQSDKAAHSYGGPKGRNTVMYGPAGHAYVYFTYGMHYCMNVVTGKEGRGEAVLIRALEPLEGIEIMQENRGGSVGLQNLCSGPAKLTQALNIGLELNSHDLRKQPLRLELQAPVPETEIVTTTRIGIKHGVELLQRFYIRDSQWISKP